MMQGKKYKGFKLAEAQEKVKLYSKGERERERERERFKWLDSQVIK